MSMVKARAGYGDKADDARKATLDSVKHLRLLMAARILTIQWRRGSDGRFDLPSGARLALLAAIDESWDVVKGVTDGDCDCEGCATMPASRGLVRGRGDRQVNAG